MKTAAIILVAIDHFGYFFVEDADWWSVFGRLAAPPFFFLLGYARTRTVPLNWIWLGVILTLLDSWNAGWTRVAPNILLSFALIRVSRPGVKIFLQHYDWVAFALLVMSLLAVHPVAAMAVDYGAEGWLWALFGLVQRMYVDGGPAGEAGSVNRGLAPPSRAMTQSPDLMRLLACSFAAVFYIWQEQREFWFSQVHFTTFVLGLGVLCLGLVLFRRGPSRIQSGEPLAAVLGFIGRHTLEIYVIQLAGSELLIQLFPDLAP